MRDRFRALSRLPGILDDLAPEPTVSPTQRRRALLRLATLVRAKMRAAGVFGMEVEVVESIETELRAYAEPR